MMGNWLKSLHVSTQKNDCLNSMSRWKKSEMRGCLAKTLTYPKIKIIGVNMLNYFYVCGYIVQARSIIVSGTDPVANLVQRTSLHKTQKEQTWLVILMLDSAFRDLR